MEGNSPPKVMAYAIFSSHHQTAAQFGPKILDFDPQKGYAAKPGYIDKAIQVLRGEREPFNTPFEIVFGHRLDNFVNGTIMGQYFVSSRFEEMLVQEKMTGYRLRPETVLSASGDRLSYKRLIVTGQCGRLHKPDEYEIGDTWHYVCLGGPPDGSDFFVVEGWGGIMCSERIAALGKKHKLRLNLFKCELQLPG